MGTPERLGKYEIVRALGSGGMAETYLARLVGEAGVSKLVVIKRVLAHRAADEAFVRAFIDEARLSATLSHANVIQVFDFGRSGDEHFLAMEYVRGIDLADLLRRARERGFEHLPAPLACLIMRDALRGLHYAHTRLGPDGRPLGIVHRDVSPSNVLVGFEGEVKIIDFGVAKAHLAGRQDTEPGIVKGKLQYMSPEQASAEPLDARSDVFAAGVVLYQLLSGRLPFAGSGAAVLHSIVRGEFPSLLAVNERLPPPLATLVAQALGNRRESRLQSAGAFADGLDRVMQQELPACTLADVGWFACEIAEVAPAPDRGPPPAFVERLEAWRRQCARRASPLESARQESETPEPAPTRSEGKVTPYGPPHASGAPVHAGHVGAAPPSGGAARSQAATVGESPRATQLAAAATLSVVAFCAVALWHELRGGEASPASTGGELVPFSGRRPQPGPSTTAPAEAPQPSAPAPSNRFGLDDVVVPMDPARHTLRVQDLGPPATVRLESGATLRVSKAPGTGRLPLLLTGSEPGTWRAVSKPIATEMLVGPGVFRFFVADMFTVLGPESFGVQLSAPRRTVGLTALTAGVEVTPAVVGLPDLEGRYLLRVRGPPGAVVLVASDHSASAQAWHEPVAAGNFFNVTGASRVGFALAPGAPEGPVSVLVAAERAMTPLELAERACAVATALRVQDPEAARFADMTCRSGPDSRVPGAPAVVRRRENTEVRALVTQIRQLRRDGGVEASPEAARLVSACIERFPGRCECLRVSQELELPFKAPLALERTCRPAEPSSVLQEEPSQGEKHKLRMGIEAAKSLRP